MADIVSRLPTQDQSDGATGSATPTEAILIGGSDGTDLRALSVTTAGAINVVINQSSTGSSPTAATIGVASGTVIASNTARKGLVLTNTSVNVESFNIAGGAAVLRSGITLYPGGVWVMDQYTFTTAAINGIASAASSNCAIQELT